MMRYWRGLELMCAGLVLTGASLMVGAKAADMTAREVTVELVRASQAEQIDLSGKDLTNLDLSGLDFKRARLANTDLFGSDLTSADLSGADMPDVRLDRATLTRANLSGANLARASILRPNIFGTLEPSRDERPDFSNARMSEAHLAGRFDLVSFAGADLTEAVFAPRPRENETLITPRTELSGCNFAGAVLRRADLGYNNLQFANFSNADLSGASLKGANLSAANFTGADLTDADFSDAVIAGAQFKGAIGMDKARGLTLAIER